MGLDIINHNQVRAIVAGSQADRLGVQPGWSFIAVNDVPVASFEEICSHKEANGKTDSVPFVITFEKPFDFKTNVRVKCAALMHVIAKITTRIWACLTAAWAWLASFASESTANSEVRKQGREFIARTRSFLCEVS